MATTRSLGLTMSIPTFSKTVSFTVAGDDFEGQRFRCDPDAFNSALVGTGEGAVDTLRVSGAEIFVYTRKRPLGQQGMNKPLVNVRLQLTNPEGKVAGTLNFKQELSYTNGLTGQLLKADGSLGDWTTSSALVARLAAAACALSFQAMLGSSPASVEEALKTGLILGVVPGAA